MTCSSHKLKVIDHKGKPFGCMLPNERVDDAEGLTRARRT